MGALFSCILTRARLEQHPTGRTPRALPAQGSTGTCGICQWLWWAAYRQAQRISAHFPVHAHIQVIAFCLSSCYRPFLGLPVNLS